MNNLKPQPVTQASTGLCKPHTQSLTHGSLFKSASIKLVNANNLSAAIFHRTGSKIYAASLSDSTGFAHSLPTGGQ